MNIIIKKWNSNYDKGPHTYNYEMEHNISDISRSDISSFFKEIIEYLKIKEFRYFI